MKLPSNIILFIIAICLGCKSSNDIKDNPVYFDSILVNAKNLLDTRSPDVAIKYLDSTYNAFKNPGVGDLWRKFDFIQKVHYNLARLENDSVELKLADIYVDSALALLTPYKSKKKYIYETCISNFAKGDILLEIGKYPKAYQYFYKGKQIAETQLSKCEQANFNNRFAVLNYKQKKFRQAASLFMEAYRNELSCKKDFDNYASTQGSLSNAGLSFAKIKMSDSALICYKMALAFLANNSTRFKAQTRFTNDAKGVIYHNMASTYLENNNLNDAEKYLRKSIALNETFGKEQKNAQIARLKLAKIKLFTGNWSETENLLLDLRKGIDTLPNDRAEQDWQQLKQDLYTISGRRDLAKPHLEKYLFLKKKYEASERKTDQYDAGQAFYNLQKDNELSLLQKEKEVRNLYLVLTLGFSLLSIFIVIILFKNIKTSSKNNKALNALNRQMILQNEYLHQTLEDLEISQEQNTRVMQIITHDLRSPMAAIVGLSKFMIDEHNLSEEDFEVISLIKTSGEDSLKFINEILDKESEGAVLKTDQVDLHSLLNYCTSQLQYKANDKNQTITLESIPVTLALNREKMWRVISNLINNAIKFSANGAVIVVKLTATNDKAILSVEDNGIGIPEDLKDKIFAGDEGKRQGTSGEKSFGLGLGISKQIIEAHGGTLWFKSENFKGTTFFIELPIN